MHFFFLPAAPETDSESLMLTILRSEVDHLSVLL